MTPHAPYIQVCQLDENKYFIGMAIADLDPLENDVHYLVPGGCVVEPEPLHKTGYIAQWTGEGWRYIEDHRGETVYNINNGVEVTITTPGKLPLDVTTKPRPTRYHVYINGDWVMTAQTQQQKMKDESEAKQNQINRLLDTAAKKISEYQDLIDFADTEEEQKLGESGYKTWRQYRAALVKYQKGLVAEMPNTPE